MQISRIKKQALKTRSSKLVSTDFRMSPFYCIKIVLVVIAAMPSDGFLQFENTRPQLSTRTNRRCVFGRRYHAIGSSWHPNLGHPFGIMRCVTCHCVKMPGSSSNGKFFTKVTCHDVRKHCPKVTCSGAKIPRGECCKVCPDKGSNRLTELTSPKFTSSKSHGISSRSKLTFKEKAINDEDTRLNVDKNAKYYVSILTSQDGGPLLRSTFQLQKNDLHISLHSQLSTPPHLMEILNGKDRVLYSVLNATASRSNQQIYCGALKGLPSDIIRALDKKNLHIRATFNMTSTKTVTSRGRIIKHRALSRETFSSLLSPGNSDSSGAISMITLGRQRFNKLHIAMIFKTNANLDYTTNGAIASVRLLNGNGKQLRSTEKKIIDQENEIVEVWGTNSEILKGLGDGSLKLELTISTNDQENQMLFIGSVTTNQQCGLFQAVLSGNDCIQPARTGAAGSAIISINNDNAVSYKVALIGLSSHVTSITMIGDYRKKRSRVIADITPHYQDGQAEGRLGVLNGKELHLLLSNRVRFSVQTEQSNSGELAGYVSRSIISNNLPAFKGISMPLAGALISPPVFTGTAGQAWLYLNEDCELYFGVVVSGLNEDADSSMSVSLVAVEKISMAEFHGTKAGGIISTMSSAVYHSLNEGNAMLQVGTKSNPNGEIGGHVRIPNNCFDAGSEKDSVVNSSKEIVKLNTLNSVNIVQKQLDLDSMSCYYEEDWRKHGSEWAPEYDRKCTTCVCREGSVFCDPVSCPSLPCDKPVAMEGQCCPVCNDGFGGLSAKEVDYAPLGAMLDASIMRHELSKHKNKKPEPKQGCLYESDGKMYEYGSWWHPFIPKFGYVACANCTCNADGTIKCGKITCPQLTCENPIKKKPTDCCKSCPDVPKIPTRQRDRNVLEDSPVRMCEFGRELRAPGEKWKLKVPGVKLSCIVCQCAKHGLNYKCKRNCPSVDRSSCKKVKRSVTDCCPWRCADS